MLDSLRRTLPLMLLVLSARQINAAELRLDAERLFSTAVTHQVVRSADGHSLVLQRGVLYEDDGPAAGYSYQPNVEKLTPGVRIRKTLMVPHPQTDRAILLVARGGDLQGTINGKPVLLNKPRKSGNYWQEYEISPDLLRTGKNDVVLWGSGQVWIARDDEFAEGSATRTKHPNRSAKSTDGGKSWNDARLGTGSDIDGEYYVRLFLEQYQTTGSLTLPVMDLGNLSNKALAPPLSALGPFRIALDGETGKAGGIEIRVRSGKTLTPEEKHWSEWHTLGPDAILQKPRGRFVQIAITLKTTDPRSTPKLKAITVKSEPRIGKDWTNRVTVDRLPEVTLTGSSIPFQYEPFDHSRLKQLRRQYQLDKVVEGAKTELELIQRLAKWSSGRWKKGHLRNEYPKWDALEILSPHPDGTPVGGFCQQYNVVFLQACESFGLVGRAISLGPGNRLDKFRSGHEVVEIWSNEHRKWIYADGNFALFVVDEQSNVPLSLLEIRDRQMAALANKPHKKVKVVHLTDQPVPLKSLTERIPFLELRMIPRSNFLEQRSPLPLNQGMRGWFWTGHHTWTDSISPARCLYGNRVENRRNWNWTLNQVEVRLEATENSGEVRVHLATQTPGFRRFVVSIDELPEEAVESRFSWRLKKGKNRLTVWSENLSQRKGSPSRVVLMYR